MKLLVFTQKIDKDDATLGFFHSWITHLASKIESIEVICLEKGNFSLPKNVTVYSLGKEDGVSSLKYIKNLYKYLFLIKNSYDRVFVHMNQEYVLLAGLYWKLKDIPVYMWRNHPKGSFLTSIAVMFSTKVFCTSKASFTARFSKTMIMPVGIDTNIFSHTEGAVRKKYSICMVGRISPIKYIELALEAVRNIVASGGQVSLSIIGNPTDRDTEYFSNLENYVLENNISTCVSFIKAVPQSQLPEIYNSHEICLNLTESGSFDKTIVEATACGAIPLVSNLSLQGILPDVCLVSNKVESIISGISKIFDPGVRVDIRKDLEKFVELNSLDNLVSDLIKEFSN